MIYALTRRLSQARGIEDLARDSHAHWVRLGEQTLVWNKAGSIAAFDRKVQRADISVESIQGHEPDAELYLVSQIGRAFQETYPAVKILINKGRYLVVELLAEEAESLGRYKPLYWQARPLPLDRGILDEREAVARESIEWVNNLVSRVSKSNYSGYLTLLASFHTRHSFSTEFDEAAALVRGELQRLGYQVQLQPITVATDNSVNVVADSPGQSGEPRGLVIVTAHLDSINTTGGADALAPGADDNASGSAAVLELARVFTDHPARHDLRLILFGGEEQGLHGSTQYVAGLTTAERNRIQAVINMDMIATLNTTSPTVLLESSASFESLINHLSNAAATYTGLTVQTSLNPFASDHVPFINANIPALLTIEGADGANENVHNANDTLEHINYGLALDIVRMNVAATSLKLDIMRPASGTYNASINQLLLDDSPGIVPQDMLLI